MSKEDFGGRLRRVRVATGLSRAEVATALAVRRADVARIEHGRRRVGTRELSKLARLYRKPSAHCLVQPTGAPPVRWFHSDYRLDQRELAVIEEAGDWLAYYAWLERAALGAQRYEFPTYPPPPGDAVEQGERLAADERIRLGLGDGDAIPSIVELLEREGVKVVVQAFHSKSSVFGCFLFSEALGPCVVVNRNRAPTERRFAAAHEYAHLLLDQEDVSGGVCGRFRAHELDESRASAFAAAFLLPSGGIAARLQDADAAGPITVERVVRLSHDFGASYGAVVARLARLGWIDERHRARLERRAAAASRATSPGAGPGGSTPARCDGPGRAGMSGSSGMSSPPDRAGRSGSRRPAASASTDQVPGGTESEPVRFRSVAVEAWHCGRIPTSKLADLLDLPEADVALLLHHALLDHERPWHAPSTEPDRL